MYVPIILYQVPRYQLTERCLSDDQDNIFTRKGDVFRRQRKSTQHHNIPCTTGKAFIYLWQLAVDQRD